MNGQSSSFEVPADAEGSRLDRFLAERLTALSRSAVLRLIRDGAVEVDGARPSKAGLALRPGMRVQVAIPPPDADGPRAEQISIDIVYEDTDLVVVDKPAGLIVHAGHGQPSGTLVNALLGRGVPLAPAGGSSRPGIVPRVDQCAAGLVVVAKNAPAHRALTRAFAERVVRKSYRALVWGRPDPAEGTVERAIGRSRGNPTKMAIRGVRGRSRPALTLYRTVETMPGFALLDVDLRTGRTHQIRVHLQSIHHPIVGDERYGGRAWRGVQDPLKRKALREFERLALHAATLEFPHPSGGRAARFEAPLPAELVGLLDILRVPT